jgi:hypothetical protein
MSGSDRHARYAAATGIFFVIVAVIGFGIQPKPPASDASAAEVLEYVKDHRDALHVAQAIFGLAGFFIIWFFGALRAALSRDEGDGGRLATTAYGGGLVAVATLIVGFGLAATAELHPTRDPEITRALFDGSLLVPAVGAPAVSVFFFANSLSILRSGRLPAWLGWLGIVAGVFNALGISAVFTDHGAFAGDGVIGFFAGFLLFLVWILAASILLVRRAGEDAAAPA